MGYAYGYQVLGNLLYKNGNKFNAELLEQYDSALEGNVYSFIWKGLSEKSKSFLIAIAEGNTKVAAIKACLGITNSELQVYRSRLMKAGLIDASKRGEIHLSLPRFKEYVLFQKEFDD